MKWHVIHIDELWCTLNIEIPLMVSIQIKLHPVAFHLSNERCSIDIDFYLVNILIRFLLNKMEMYHIILRKNHRIYGQSSESIGMHSKRNRWFSKKRESSLKGLACWISHEINDAISTRCSTQITRELIYIEIKLHASQCNAKKKKNNNKKYQWHLWQ